MSSLDSHPTGPGTDPSAAPADATVDCDTPSVPPPIPVRRRLALAFLALVAVVAAGEAVHRVSDITRGSPVRSVVTPGLPAPGDSGFAALAGGVAETPLVEGNHVEVLTDAHTFRSMLEDLRAARRSITVLAYYCGPGALADSLSAVLSARARAGIEVMLLGDGFGCRTMLDAISDDLTRAGARVATLRPVRWSTLHRVQHRHHARSVVVDGTVAYTGGFGFDDRWLGDAPGELPWRDTSARVQGPVVAVVQGVFTAAWAEATGELRADTLLFGAAPTLEGVPKDPPPADGAVRAGYLVSGPGVGTRPADRYLTLTLASARRTLYLTNSYFVPTPTMRRLLLEAADRGVDVRILVPGARTDVPSTRWAGRAYYDELLAGGVRIFEYQPTMIHAKTVVADGRWVSIGSLNLDNRSLRLNDESALLVDDPGVGATMDSLFHADLTRAVEQSLALHGSRPWLERLLERLTRLVAPLL